MNKEQYKTIQKILKDADDILEYEILKYIQENIFMEDYTFWKLYPKLNITVQKYETKKMYEFMKYQQYENGNAYNKNNIITELKTEFNKNIIKSTKNQG